MKPIKVAVTLLLIAILVDSSLLVSAALPSQRHPHPQSSMSDSAPLAVLSSPAGIWAFTDGQYLPTNMSTRGEIMAYVLTNTGVYLREISEDLGLPMGVVQYHIWVLSKDGELEECRSGRYRRFFGAERYQETEQRVISMLRQGTPGRILTALSAESLPHMRLAAVLGLTSQALSWQMRRLREMGIVEAVPSFEGGRLYHLTDSAREIVHAHSAPVPGAQPRVLGAPSLRLRG